MRTESRPILAILDHDGVLVDSLPYHQQAWVELGRREGLDITDEFIHKTFGMTNPSIFELLLGNRVDAATLARYSDLKEECYRDLARGRIQLLSGAREMLDRLTSAGFLLAVGTSGVRPNIELTIAQCGLDGRFASIASLEDISRGKPDPEVFLVAAMKAGVEPRRSVVFEDAPFGIEAAKAADMLAVGITTTHHAGTLENAGADLVVDSFDQIDAADLLRQIQLRS
jgi:beta-phosphoglucomutase